MLGLVVVTAGLVAVTSPAAGAVGEDPPPGTGGGARWRWPLAPQPAVARSFSPPAQRWGRGHRGVDLSGRPGQPVLAAGAGTVRFAGTLAGRGVVSIVHGELRTTYEPVRPLVSAGQRVAAGQPVGVLAAAPSHCGWAGTCLHWGLLRGSRYLDPLHLLTRGPSRLLPVWRGRHPVASAAAAPATALPGPPAPAGPAAHTASGSAEPRAPTVAAVGTAGLTLAAGLTLGAGLALRRRATR
jgi:Peptidase family M23